MNTQTRALVNRLLRGELAGEIRVTGTGRIRVRGRDARGVPIVHDGFVDGADGSVGTKTETVSREATELAVADRRREIRRLTDLGFTQHEPALRFGLSQKTVSNDVRRTRRERRAVDSPFRGLSTA